MHARDTPPNADAAASILFVCMGNICRSPLAEGVFLHLAAERGLADRFRVDSAGTGGWHIGNPPDRRAQAVAEKHGIHLPSRARQIDPPRDWDDFDLVIVMDHQNLDHCLGEGAPPQRTRLLRAYDDELREAGESADAAHDRLSVLGIGEVPDPYFGGDDGFDTVFSMVQRSCARLLDHFAQIDTRRTL
jgi:protein-tyrosine phosphatase